MFHQLVTPVGGSLIWSCLVASIPIAAVLVLLGVFRRPAWQASSAGLAAALVLAIYVWKLPAGNALSSVFAGATFALIPVMWIVFNALVLYNVTVVSGRFQNFRDWMLDHLPNDRRVVLVVIGFCFGCLLEGIAGFGTPVAITSALLIALGFPALDAVVFTLIFNTAPVAFGALGAPVTTLGAVTQLSDTTLGAMIGRQLPFFALLLPFYAVGLYGGVRAIKGVWPVLLIAGASFASGQFIASNYLGFALTDVISSAFSLIVTIAFLKVWRNQPDPQFSLAAKSIPTPAHSAAPAAGWIPWIILAATVVLWIHLHVNLVGQVAVHWPRLHEEVFITIYDKPYAAIWTFQPLGTGTAILFATVITAFVVRLKPRQVSGVLLTSLAQVRLPALTTTLIIGLAYLMNYSGMTYTLGVGAASAGVLFPLLSAFLGWLAVSLSGSDTSGNALFGNLQVVAARQLDLNPVLMAATNSSGGVFGKMISPQNISTGTSTSELKGREGDVFARTFKHSLILTLLLGLLVLLQQYVFPWMIPS
ncbi:MAG TPA: L-lactate permease [Steroidobacteraceae bacterium]|jgi:lactate permease|nr:L-lactate permease [Steroidobacteraceae bacterium]